MIENKKGLRLVADFGGTRVKYGIAQNGSLLDQDNFSVVDRLNFGPQADLLEKGFSELLNKNGLSFADCDGVGVAFPSLVSADRSKVTRTFQKFDDLVGFDLQAWSQSAFGLPCSIENDARAALIGEWHHGAGRGCDNLFMLTLGTGCGTAVVLEGKPIYGHSGMAGNLGGHSITHRDGELCWCGSRGCLEAQVASWALEDIASKQPSFKASKLAHVQKVDYKEVFSLAAEGDQLAIRLRERAIDTWATVILNGLSFFDPEKVIVGGGVMASADVIVPALQRIIDAEAIHVGEPVQVVAAELADGAALLGV